MSEGEHGDLSKDLAKHQQLPIRLTNKQRAKLEAWAAELDCSMGEVIRRLIDGLPLPGDKTIDISGFQAILELLRKEE